MTRTWVVVSTRDAEVVTTIVLADDADAAFAEACEMWTEKEQEERHLVAVVQVDGKGRHRDAGALAPDDPRRPLHVGQGGAWR